MKVVTTCSLPAVFILLLLLCKGPEVAAQTKTVIKEIPNVNDQGYFARRAKKRFMDILSLSRANVAEELAIITRLETKSDSTLQAIQLDSANYSPGLKALRQHHDSITFLIARLEKELDQPAAIKKNFNALNGVFTSLEKYVTEYKPWRSQDFATVDRKIDSAGLMGEKVKLKTLLNNATAQNEKEAAKVAAIDVEKDSLLNLGNIDAGTSKKLDNRLQLYQKRIDSLNNEISQVRKKLDNATDIKKDFKLIKARVLLIDSVVNKGAAGREYVFTMISEGLRISKPNLFSLAAFFGAGGYNIPKEKYALAREYFSPLIDSLIKFSNRYATVVRISSVAINGYADASAIARGTKLYGILSNYLKKPQPSKLELNAALSALRAADLSQFLTMMIKEKSSEFLAPNKIVFESLEEGMGENLPDPSITDYKPNDERRRIVIIFWSVLPAE